MSEQWKQGVVYLEHFSKDGSSYAAEHNCWNTDLFIERSREAAKDAGGSVRQITKEQYLKVSK